MLEVELINQLEENVNNLKQSIKSGNVSFPVLNVKATLDKIINSINLKLEDSIVENTFFNKVTIRGNEFIYLDTNCKTVWYGKDKNNKWVLLNENPV